MKKRNRKLSPTQQRDLREAERRANTIRVATELLGRPTTKVAAARFYGISLRELNRRIEYMWCFRCKHSTEYVRDAIGGIGADATHLCQICQDSEGVTKALKAAKVERGATTSIFCKVQKRRRPKRAKTPSAAQTEAKASTKRKPAARPKQPRRTRVKGFIGVKYYASNPGPDGPTGVYRMIRDAEGITPQSWAGSGWMDDTYAWYKITSGGDVENITEEEARRLIISWGSEPVDMDFPPPGEDSPATRQR